MVLLEPQTHLQKDWRAMKGVNQFVVDYKSEGREISCRSTIAHRIGVRKLTQYFFSAVMFECSTIVMFLEVTTMAQMKRYDLQAAMVGCRRLDASNSISIGSIVGPNF